jgi:predicted amidohydrolase
MSRVLTVAGAQMGPTQRADSRAATLARMIALLDRAAAGGAKLVVFPELAFTTFFPRWPMERDAPELLACFEPAMPNPVVQPLFDRARALGVGFYVGYAELTPDGRRFNTAVTVGPDGAVLFSYRKIHLPGSDHVKPGQRYQQLEKMYFDYGDLGFPVARGPKGWGRPVLGMLVCNDRRWPEGWRVLGLQGVELVMVGYNSAAYDPNGGEGESAERRTFHSTLAAQANAYMNATWAVAVAKAGVGGRRRPHRRVLHRRPERGGGRAGRDPRRRGDPGRGRPRRLPARQGEDVRLRRPPPAAMVRADHRPDRRHAPAVTAAGETMSRRLVVAAAQMGPIQKARAATSPSPAWSR